MASLGHACCVFAFLSTGCVQTVEYAELGYAHAFAQAPERSAFAGNVMGGISVRPAEDAPVGAVIGGALRSKWSDNVDQFAIAPWARMYLGFVYLDAGVDLLSIESIVQQSSVSIGSPFVGAGFHVFLGKDVALTLGATFEYDIRFNSIPNTGYVSFMLGVGAFKNLFRW